MHSCLLKKLVPFALTFVVGAAIGGLFKSHVTTWTTTERSTLNLGQGGYGYGHSCRMYRRNLVAETKPLVILYKPAAWWPHDSASPAFGNPFGDDAPARVRVTFGADGKVHEVEALDGWKEWKGLWEQIERAARQIQFEPETVNGIPVSVTKDVEINFATE